MTCHLRSIGTAVPENSLPQQATYAIAESLSDSGGRGRTAAAIYRRTGVSRRGSVLFAGEDDAEPQRFYDDAGSPCTASRMREYDRHARTLAASSASAAIEAAGLRGADVAHLVTTSCTGFASPGWELSLFESAGLPADCPRTQVGFMGCHAAFNAVRAASALVSSTRRPVLVCCTELCSLHMQYAWDSEKVVANALFADGSASVVLSPEAGGLGRVIGAGSLVAGGTESLMSWHVGNHGFEMTLSPEVADVVRTRLPDWVDGLLAEHGLRRGDVAGWACHPGGPRILSAVEESLGLDGDALAASRGVLRDHGNMSSPTILFVLNRMAGHVRGPVVALGFGPGLTFEAMLLDFG